MHIFRAPNFNVLTFSQAAVLIVVIVFVLLAAVAIFIFVRNRRLTANYTRLKEERGGGFELHTRNEQIGIPLPEDESSS
jgi:hypothetical protein